MRSTRDQTELRFYFEIKSELVAAVKDAAPDALVLLLDELSAIQMHTGSDRLRLACAATIASHTPPADAVSA